MRWSKSKYRIDEEIIDLIQRSIDELTTKRLFEITRCPPISLQTPKDESCGDLSTNIAMQLAHQLRIPSKEIAKALTTQIEKRLARATKLGERIERIEMKSPGFINFFLSLDALYDVLSQIRKEGPNYGRSWVGKGERVQIEFVSANPTGPLTIAHGRQAAVGDALSNILNAVGYRVKKEYYINDEGRQIDCLARSIRARYLEVLGEPYEFPEGGYLGKYISDIAGEIQAKHGRKFVDMPEEKSLPFFSSYSVGRILEGIKQDLERFGVDFDLWFSQKSLTGSGKVKRAIKVLSKKGHLYRKDGALWFRSTRFGDDKDRVLIKGDGAFTYITPDIAYHRDKFQRGFKKVIDIWGPDHHGYVPRLEAAIQALGYPKEDLKILLIQLVTLYKGKEPIPMSTRAGEYVTLQQLMDEVGCDAGRFFFLMRKMDSHFDFDLELAKSESLENPVYYVQYAHARICSIGEFAKQKISRNIDRSLLTKPQELELLKLMMHFPEVIQVSAKSLEPHLITLYLRQLATSFHSYYTEHRVVTDDKRLTEVRLLLVDCVRQVLKNGLSLLGVSAPEKM